MGLFYALGYYQATILVFDKASLSGSSPGLMLQLLYIVH